MDGKESLLKFEEIQQSETSYALIRMNIKNFRYYNAKYGRETGNQILKDVYDLIKSTLTQDDYIVREYADNFLIYKSYIKKEDVIDHWLYPFIDKIFDIPNSIIFHNIYTSFGIYYLDDKTCSFDKANDLAELCRKYTDSISYRVFSYEIYQHDFYEKYMKARQIEELTGLAREKGLYQVYIQPKVDARTDKICGGEALLRLFDEDGNMIPIVEFLPILNKNGYIRMVDMWEYEEVLRCMDQRIKEHKRIVNMSFNISNSHFHDIYLFSDYKEVSDKYDVPRNMITCEFLESISIDEQKMNELIKTFHEEGFQCALDDFGNGCSSFNVLRYADIDSVKIDRCFFQDSPCGNKIQVLKAVVEMLKILKLHIVAEGVEEKEDIQLMKKLGVDEIQGFYYYKPMPMNEFFALLDQEDEMKS